MEESVLFKPFRDLQRESNFSQTEVRRLQAGAKTIIKSEIRPAFEKLLRCACLCVCVWGGVCQVLSIISEIL